MHWLHKCIQPATQLAKHSTSHPATSHPAISHPATSHPASSYQPIKPATQLVQFEVLERQLCYRPVSNNTSKN